MGRHWIGASQIATRRGWPSHIAWAIECEPGQLIGPLWFEWQGSDQGQFAGYRSAAFRTRAAARLALKRVRGPAIEGRYPKARIVRVRVCLDVARPTQPKGTDSR